MPRLQLRKPNEVPARTTANRAIRERQEIYEGFIRQVNGNVGELELNPDETARSVKVRLRRASSRVGTPLEIWDVNNRVYFKAASRPRGPRTAST